MAIKKKKIKKRKPGDQSVVQARRLRDSTIDESMDAVFGKQGTTIQTGWRRYQTKWGNA